MSDRTNMSRGRRLFPSHDHRLVTGVLCVIAVLCILVGGHLYGRYLSSLDLGGRDNAIAAIRAENQKTKRQLDQKSAQATELQAKLDKVQATLNAIMPSQNTYNIQPNQSLVIGGLTVGLVGSPGNENVTLDINGKQQVVDAGQTITVAPDASTNCQVQVQSFDMFKAVLVASCSGAKPQ